jgi:uncharacterized protein YcbK (DUF882 family)
MLSKENLKRANFSPDEFFASETAKKLGIKNYPPASQEVNILTCLLSTADMMQEIRNLLGKSIKINSAYRCLEVNRAVASKDNSQHLQGLACDFICPEFGTPEEIVKFLRKNNVLVDQCFNEGSWVHISRVLVEKSNRMMYGYYLLDASGKRIFNAIY